MSSLERDNAIYAEIGADPVKEDFDITKNAAYEDPKRTSKHIIIEDRENFPSSKKCITALTVTVVVLALGLLVACAVFALGNY